jgi:hypothetical protein
MHIYKLVSKDVFIKAVIHLHRGDWAWQKEYVMLNRVKLVLKLFNDTVSTEIVSKDTENNSEC